MMEGNEADLLETQELLKNNRRLLAELEENKDLLNKQKTRIRALNDQVNSAHYEKNKATQLLTNLQEDFKETQGKLEDVISEKENTNRRHDVLASQIKSISHEFAQKEKLLQDELKQAHQNSTELVNKQRAWKEKNEGLQEALEVMKGQLETSLEEKESLSQFLQNQQREISHEYEQLQDKLRKKEQACLELKQILLEKANEIEAKQKENYLFRQNVQTLRQDLNHSEKKNEAERKHVSELENMIDEEKKKYVGEKKTLASQITQLNTTIKYLEEKLNNFQNTVLQLEESKSQLHESLNHTKEEAQQEQEQHKQLHDNLQVELGNRIDEINTLQNEKAKYDCKIKELRVEAAVLREEQERREMRFHSENQKLHQQFDQSKKQCIKYEQDILFLEAKMDELKNNNKSIVSEKNKEISSIRKYNQQIEDENESTICNLKQEKEDILKQMKELSFKHENNTALQRNKEIQLIKEIKHLQNSLHEAQNKCKENLDELRGTLKDVESRRVKAAKECDEFKSLLLQERLCNRDLVKNVDDLQQEIQAKDKMTQDIRNNTKEETQTLTSQLESLRMVLEKFRGEHSLLKEEKMKVIQKLHESESNVKSLHDDLGRLKEEKIYLNKIVSELRSNISSLSKDKLDIASKGNTEANQLRVKINELNQIIKSQERELENLSTKLLNTEREFSSYQASSKDALCNFSNNYINETIETGSKMERHVQDVKTQSLKALAKVHLDMENLAKNHTKCIKTFEQETESIRKCLEALEVESNEVKLKHESNEPKLNRILDFLDNNSSSNNSSLEEKKLNIILKVNTPNVTEKNSDYSISPDSSSKENEDPLNNDVAQNLINKTRNYLERKKKNSMNLFPPIP